MGIVVWRKDMLAVVVVGEKDVFGSLPGAARRRRRRRRGRRGRVLEDAPRRDHDATRVTLGVPLRERERRLETRVICRRGADKFAPIDFNGRAISTIYIYMYIYFLEREDAPDRVRACIEILLAAGESP